MKRIFRFVAAMLFLTLGTYLILIYLPENVDPLYKEIAASFLFIMLTTSLTLLVLIFGILTAKCFFKT